MNHLNPFDAKWFLDKEQISELLSQNPWVVSTWEKKAKCKVCRECRSGVQKLLLSAGSSNGRLWSNICKGILLALKYLPAEQNRQELPGCLRCIEFEPYLGSPHSSSTYILFRLHRWSNSLKQIQWRRWHHALITASILYWDRISSDKK